MWITSTVSARATRKRFLNFSVLHNASQEIAGLHFLDRVSGYDLQPLHQRPVLFRRDLQSLFFCTGPAEAAQFQPFVSIPGGFTPLFRRLGFFRNYPFPLLLIYLNLASSNRLPQRPYMVLFIILSLLFVPSTKPLLYSYATAFSIASISRLNPSAKLFSGFRALLLYFSTNKYNKGTFRFLNILRNSFIQQCSSQIFGYFS